jgi:molybdopterin converting factor small subunit
VIVRVRLLGEFRRYLGGRAEPLLIELLAEATVADVVAATGIDPHLEAIVGVNGQLAGLAGPLADGDEVVFVSPMSGGRD